VFQPTDPLTWAETHLLASPGALVSKDGKRFRIPTLVPAVTAEGRCINLDPQERCVIHADAPFGCAFFDHGGPEQQRLAHAGLVAVYEVWETRDAADYRPAEKLYRRIWLHLANAGLTQYPPELLRRRMGERI
jgi:hypothetical protein